MSYVTQQPEYRGWKFITLNRDARCSECCRWLREGQQGYWSKGKIKHPKCMPAPYSQRKYSPVKVTRPNGTVWHTRQSTFSARKQRRRNAADRQRRKKRERT